MRRPVVAALVVVAAVATMASGAVALTVANDRSDGPGVGMHAMTPSSSAWSLRDSFQHDHGVMHSAAVDTEFAYLTQMVAHHKEAVAAARELEGSNRPQLRAFGANIVLTQSAQIDQMTDWLAEWYPERSIEVDYQPMMRDLSDLSGDRLDQAFLEDMVPHHMAAVMMSQQLLMRRLADHELVTDLARAIRNEQHNEILQMRRWLATWFGAD